MNVEDIEAVLERVRGGETAAYAEVVRAYQRDAYRVAVYALRSREETEDLVQQAFVRAFERLDRFESGRDFGAWIRGITRNLVREHLRKRAREDARMRRYLHHLEAQAPEPEADDREASMRRALADCRGELSEAAQQALKLRYDLGHDFGVIAETIGRTLAGARQLLQRTRVDLRQCIEGKLA